MKKLAIIGAGDLGQLIAYYAEEDNQYIVVGFFDDNKTELNATDNHKILGKLSDIIPMYQKGLFDCILIGIGYRNIDIREKVFADFYGKVPFGKIIHSSCFVSSSSRIEEGCVLLPGCIIDRNVIIEANVFMNIAVTVAHDSIVRKNSFFASSVAIAGCSVIGEKCFLGMNCTIIDNITIGNAVQLGGGAVVIKNIINPGLYVGNPARFIR